MRDLTKIVERLEQLDRDMSKGWRADLDPRPNGVGHQVVDGAGMTIFFASNGNDDEYHIDTVKCAATTRNLLPLLIAALKGMRAVVIEQDMICVNDPDSPERRKAELDVEIAARDFAALLTAQESSDA